MITDYVLLSAYNVWSSVLQAEKLGALSRTCQAGLFGDLVSWTDIVSHDSIATKQIESPSLCDCK